MALNDEIRKLNPGNLIDLYEIDLNPTGINQILYLAPYSDSAGQDLVFQGQTYQAFPVVFSGFEKKGSGAEARPKASVSNYSGILSQYLQQADDFVGAKITRKRTLAQYLNTSTHDESAYVKEVYYIEQKVSEVATMIEFEMSSALDFLDKKLPGRIVIANSCPWSYKSVVAGSSCSWPGTDPSKWFDRFGTPVGSASLDVCGKRLSDCKLRFGEANPLDYGGAPTLGRV